MNPRNVSLHRRLAATFGVAALASSLAGPALATPETLKRSAGNILFAPMDLVLSPVVAGRTLAANLRESDDSRWVRGIFVAPGYLWTVGVELCGGVIREIAGLVELLPGLALVFFDADLDPLYELVEHADALVETETAPLRIKFGVSYTAVSH